MLNTVQPSEGMESNDKSFEKYLEASIVLQFAHHPEFRYDGMLHPDMMKTIARDYLKG